MAAEKQCEIGEECVCIPRDVYEELRRVSEEMGIPMGKLLRRLLEKF